MKGRINNENSRLHKRNGWWEIIYRYGIYVIKWKNDTMNLYDIIDEFKALGHYEDDEIENRIVQFYTDLNTDGRF